MDDISGFPDDSPFARSTLFAFKLVQPDFDFSFFDRIDEKSEQRFEMNGTHLWNSQFRRAPVHAWKSTTTPAARRFTAGCQWRQNADSSSAKGNNKENGDGEVEKEEEEKEQSAMSRRLSQMTEDAILEGGRSARRNIENAGFSEDLKRQLEERVLAASFKSENAAAHSIVDMPVSIKLPLRCQLSSN